MNGFPGRGSEILAAIIGAILLSGCGSYPTLPDIAAEINSTLEPAPIRVAPGDTIDLQFPRRTEWNHAVVVRPDGRASFLFLDELSVAGMTIEALDRSLTKAYQDRGVMVDTDLTVNLTGIVARNVMVIGEVNSPGQVPIVGGRISFIEAIARSGGPIKESALLEEAMLVRWMPSEGRQRVWYINAAIDYWGTGTPLLLQANDLIFVPNTGIDSVNIWVDQHLRLMIPIPGILPIAQ